MLLSLWQDTDNGRETKCSFAAATRKQNPPSKQKWDAAVPHETTGPQSVHLNLKCTSSFVSRWRQSFTRTIFLSERHLPTFDGWLHIRTSFASTVFGGWWWLPVNARINDFFFCCSFGCAEFYVRIQMLLSKCSFWIHDCKNILHTTQTFTVTNIKL